MLENKFLIFNWCDGCEGYGSLRFLFRYTLFLINNFGLFLFDGPLVFLFGYFLVVLINHLGGRPVSFKVLQVEPSYQLFASKFEGFLCNFVELLIVLDDLLDMNLEPGVHFFRVHSRSAWHFLDDVDYPHKYLWLVPLHKCHEILDLLFFRLVDNQLVSIIHVSVQLFSQLMMMEQGVVNLDEAVILIFSLFIFPQKFSDVLVGL